MAPWEGASKREWRMEMRVPARALKPLVVLAVAAASVGCVSPAAYAVDAGVSVTSDSSNHVVVDVDLSACASDSGSDRQGAEKDGQGESVSETEADETMAALWELSAASNIIFKGLVILLRFANFPRGVLDARLIRITGAP